jgi:hypothetical protein
MSDTEPLYEKILHEDEIKGHQLRLVISEFRDKEYLHIRKYFLSFDEGWKATKEGIHMELSLSNSYALLDGMVEICSKLEDQESISEHFKEIMEKIEWK